MKPDMIFYFASTHWDREWYKTVDEFRYMLVPVLDKIIDTLRNDPDFKIFTTDGQTCMLEDYLTVREERREELIRLIKDGRLVVGPWYTMPDEFLLSGESLIQNLLAGHAAAVHYGAEPLKTGYVCDTFGHIANLPQILRGFQIDNALISRGANDCELECFFNWTSPDGSRVLVFKAPETCGYGSFYYEALYEFAPDYAGHLDEITEKAIQYVERELTRSSLPYVILMDGMDHETIHEFMPEILRRLSAYYHCPVVQERLDEVFPEIKEKGAPAGKTGELCAHGKDNVMHNKLIPHTLSSRYDIKKANDACQNLLERYAMPCAAIDEMYGRDYTYAYLTYSYRLLLQNHAHDSICGCSVDAVHREMLTRFDKSYRTAKEYFTQFCGAEYQKTSCPGGGCRVKIFNPLPYEYTGCLEFDIDFPPDFPATDLPYVKYEQRNSFLIFDEEGREIKYNLVQAFRAKQVRQFGGNKRPADTHRAALIATLKPMAFTSFYIKPYDKPYRIMERFSTAPNACENEWIHFEINPDGTVTIVDKETGYTCKNLHSFTDCCEMGDGWYHIRPIRDRVISSSGCKVTVEKTFDGYAACKFLVRYELTLPVQRGEELGFANRSRDYRPYLIESEFTVSRTSKLVQVRTTVHNTVLDHRLQLHLPTGVSSKAYYVNQCNLIVERATGPDTGHYSWKEADITEYSFESMVLIRDLTHGLLFLSKGGLHEVSCPGDSENSMDITLLRCFSNTVGTNGETDGQLQGTHTFEYALMPLSTESNCDMVKIRDQYVSGYMEFTVPESRISADESAFTFRSRDSVYITCMPSSREGILIRAANYSATDSETVLEFARPVKSATLCDFLENPLETAKVSKNLVTVTAPPYKMITVRVEFRQCNDLCDGQA